MRLHYFDYFRAITIILIVLGHSWTKWTIDTVPELIVVNIIGGSTPLFVFISGFFFHHIFYKKFDLKLFILKKSKVVLSPYIIQSSLAFIVIVLFLEKPSPYLVFDTDTPTILVYLKYMWTGRVLTAYWYIPFVMMLFILSPVFIVFIKSTKLVQLSVFFFLLLVSLIIHRPGHGLSPIHSLLYFPPLYLLGILYSIYSEHINRFISNKSLVLGFLALFFAFIQSYFYGSFGSFQKAEIFSFNGIDVSIIQKIFLIFFILSVLISMRNTNISFLKYIAKISFPIFFIHPWVLFFIGYFSLNQLIIELPGIIIFAITAIFTLVVSILLANIVKLLLKDKSKYAIGW